MSPECKVRQLAAGAAAVAALASAAPAFGQEMGYEERVYEYAQPLPAGEVPPVFVSHPVVQPLPSAEEGHAEEAEDHSYEYEVETVSPAPPHYPVAGAYGAPVYARPAPPPPIPGYPHYQSYPPAGYQGPQGDYGYQAAYPPMPPVVDRDAWIADCRAYLRERRRQADRGAIGGGLLGAAAGGILGNRIADGERLGGTLIGAGVGGLVGLFIGQAIALAGGDGTKKDCKNWLRTYEESYANGGRWPGYGHYPYPGPMWGHGWGGSWSGGYMVVPQTTVVVTQGVPMVPVVREIVREEWVEEDVVTYRKVTPAPTPKRKVRMIKSKPVKYIKGK
ncbi:glycine zipper 2TM domain-containing protein [Parerythrobacter aurantius]|uniref:glycine zipper 2TM domain-containing protein n=1 Tax=Parerythrobacter aurantius TaxID=3127706 RepID=UPI003251984E